MADINALADSAERKLEAGDAITRPDAVRKAIKGQGISSENDIRRLLPQVCAELGRRGREKQLRKKAAAAAAKRLHEQVAP